MITKSLGCGSDRAASTCLFYKHVLRHEKITALLACQQCRYQLVPERISVVILQDLLCPLGLSCRDSIVHEAFCV